MAPAQARLFCGQEAQPGACPDLKSSQYRRPLDTKFALALTLVNRAPLAGQDQISIQLFDPDGKEVFSVVQEAPPRSRINTLREITLNPDLRPGQYQADGAYVKFPA